MQRVSLGNCLPRANGRVPSECQNITFSNRDRDSCEGRRRKASTEERRQYGGLCLDQPHEVGRDEGVHIHACIQLLQLVSSA